MNTNTPQNFDVHFCLVSEQAAANLLPILDKDFRPKEVVLLVSSKMVNKGEYLENVIKQQCIKVTVVNIGDAYSIDEMDSKMTEIITRYECSNVALNVTGGTKLMAIVAINLFNCIAKPVFYVDTSTNKIIFINEKGKSKELNTRIKIETYLQAYGNSIIGRKESEVDISNYETSEKFQFSEEVLLERDKYENCIGLLNGYATEARNHGNKIQLNGKNTVFVQFLKDLSNKGLVKFENPNIDFIDSEHRRFLNGEWLELYTYSKIEQIRRSSKKIQDVALGLEVGNSLYKPKDKQNSGKHNEFDVVFMANNIMHIIECKTTKIKDNEDSNNYLYKLQALKDYGGLYTKKCLISYHKVSESIKNRAKDLRIEIIEGNDLRNINHRITTWIDKSF